MWRDKMCGITLCVIFFRAVWETSFSGSVPVVCILWWLHNSTVVPLILMKFVLLKFNATILALNYLFTVMKFKQFWKWSIFCCEIIISAKIVGLGLNVMIGSRSLMCMRQSKEQSIHPWPPCFKMPQLEYSV